MWIRVAADSARLFGDGLGAENDQYRRCRSTRCADGQQPDRFRRADRPVRSRIEVLGVQAAAGASLDRLPWAASTPNCARSLGGRRDCRWPEGHYRRAGALLRLPQPLPRQLRRGAAVPLMMPIPALAEVQVALQTALAKVTGDRGEALKRRLRTGTVVTNDDCNWELRWTQERRLINISRAIAVDMESAAVATPRLPHAGALRHPVMRVRQTPARGDQAARRRQRLLRTGDRRAPPDRNRRHRSAAKSRRRAALAQAAQFRRAAVPVSERD